MKKKSEKPNRFFTLQKQFLARFNFSQNVKKAFGF